VKTTTIQIARVLRDALTPGDLARVVEALEGYLIDNDPETGKAPPSPTVARRAEVAGDLIDRIEAHLRDDEAAALADDDPERGSTTPRRRR
jgi:hypothetical protein